MADQKSAISHAAKDGPGDKMDFGDLYWKMAKAFVYHIFRVIYNVLQFIVWVITGIHFQYMDAWKPENYPSSAQVYDILYRYKFDVILGQASFEDFILSHNKFVHPNYVLRDECELYQVTKKFAVFVEVAKGVDVWRGKYGSFLRQAEFLEARRVITMPLYALHHLANEVGDTSAKLIFVQNTSRCGSTLLVRIFEETGRCVSYCEPDAVNGMCKLATTKKLWDNEKGKEMVRSVIRLMCKPVKRLKKPPLAYILKMTAPTMEAAPFLAESFPEAYHYFMYRDCTKICESLSVAAEEMPTLKQLYLLGSISAAGLAFGISQMGCSSTEWNIQISGHPYEPGILVYAITIRKYLQMLADGIKIGGIRYEDLAKDAEFCVAKILEYSGLPQNLLEPAMGAMGKDAQKYSALNTDNLRKKKKNYKLTPQVSDFMEQIFTEFGVPLEPAPILPNTITQHSMYEGTPTAEAIKECIPTVQALDSKISHVKDGKESTLALAAESADITPADEESQSEELPVFTNKTATISSQSEGPEKTFEAHEESDRSSSSSFEVIDRSSDGDSTKTVNGNGSLVHPMAPKFIRFT